MLDLGEIKLRAANPSMYRGTVIDRELVGDVRLLIDEVEQLQHEVAKVSQDIRRRVDRHADTWSERSDCYWFYRLSQEVGELGSSLALDHEHSPEYEIAQIASICINWLTRKEREEANPLQPCGHPKSARVSAAVMGPRIGTSYCGICNAEAEAEVRRDDRTIESPESEPLPEPQEEEVHY